MSKLPKVMIDKEGIVYTYIGTRSDGYHIYEYPTGEVDPWGRNIGLGVSIIQCEPSFKLKGLKVIK